MRPYHIFFVFACAVAGCCGTVDAPDIAGDYSPPAPPCTMPPEGQNAALTCATVYRGKNGTPADLPAGSCDAEAWAELRACVDASCSWPAACAPSCQACAEAKCTAQIVYCLTADGQH